MPDAITPELSQAVFTGGCFWTLEAVFRRLKGVKSARPGTVWMAAGLPPQESPQRYPVEKMEAVWVEWDPAEIGMDVLTEVLLTITSPSLVAWGFISELSGARSAIFTASAMDVAAAESVVQPLRDAPTGLPVYTQVIPWLPAWVPAPAFDLGYYERNPGEGFCRSIIQPKLDRMAHRFAPWWQGSPNRR